MQFDIRRFDIYRKVPKDLTQPTVTGAIISVCSVLFILFLLVSELSLFIAADLHSELTVEDPVLHTEKIPVFLNITLLKTGCEYLGLDIQDAMGRHEVGFKDNTVKTPYGEAGCRLESHFLINKGSTWVLSQHIGKPFVLHQIDWAFHRRVIPEKYMPQIPHIIPMCWQGPEVLACKMVCQCIWESICATPHQLGPSQEGISAIDASKPTHHRYALVPGNFHVSTHSTRQQPENPDMSHILHRVRFGMDLEKGKEVRGSFNPLHNVDKSKSDPISSHDYILQVVPTVYEDIKGNIRYPFQYTYSSKEMIQYQHGGRIIPAIWFRYQLSPITVHYREKRQPFYTFLTTICAIVGGTFTVAGIVDSLIFTAAEVFRKIELGKLS